MKIFENHQLINNCKGACNINDTTKDLCISLQRIITAHNYYQLLDVEHNKDDMEIFTSFINQVYGQNILNDYEHLMKGHKGDIYEIHTIITKSAGKASKCDISKCKYSERHYLRDERQQNDNNNDEQKVGQKESDFKISFYCDLFDGVHFYLVHAFDSGIRIVPKKYRKDDDLLPDEQHIKNKTYYDHEFKKVRDEVIKKRESTIRFNRAGTSNTKFTIGVAGERDEIDGMYPPYFLLLLVFDVLFSYLLGIR